MAYSTANRPYLVVPAVAGGFNATVVNGVAGSSDCGGSIWMYRSTNTFAEAAASNFFADGHKLGLRKGDIMFVQAFSTALATGAMGIGVVATVNASSAASITASIASS
jgi:hypothetical protein